MGLLSGLTSSQTIAIALELKDNATKQLAGVEKRFGALGGVLKGVGIGAAAAAGAILGTGAALGRLALEAAPLEQVQKAFAGISGDADKMLDALQEGSAGMVAQTDLMKTYNTAAQLVGKTFADELPSAMEYLGKVSAATGQDMGFMLDSLVKGIGRLSPMILDNLGVQVSLEEATSRAATMFGVEADALSKAQQQAGMMAVVMEKLRANTASMPDLMGSTAQKIAAYKASIADARQEMGAAFLPVMNELLGIVAPLARDITGQLVPAIESIAPRIIGAIQGLTEFGGKLGKFASDLALVVGQLEKLANLNLIAWKPLPALEEMGVLGQLAAKIRDVVTAEADVIRSQQALDAAMQDALATEQQVQTAFSGIAAETYNLADAMAKASPRMKAHWDEMRAALNNYADDAKLAQAGLYDNLTGIALEGQGQLLALQSQWAAQSQAMQFEEQITAITTAQDRAMRLAEIEAQFNAEMAALQAQGNAQKIADLQVAHQIELTELGNKYAQEDALSERAQLIEQAKLAQSRIAELNLLRASYQQEIAVMIAQAGAKAELTDAEITARLTALGLELSTEAQIAVEHAKLNEQKLLSDQAYAKGYVDTLKSMVDAAIKAQSANLADAMAALNNWSPPAITLPPISIGTGDFGGGGAAPRVETVAESLEATIGRISDTLTRAVAALNEVAEYEAKDLTAGMQALADNLQEAVTIMMHTAWTFGDASRDWRDIPKAAAEFAGWASSVASAFGTAAGVLKAVGEYEVKDITAQLEAISQGAQDMIVLTQDLQAWFELHNKEWRKVAEEISAFSQYMAQIVGWIKPGVDALTALGEYAELEAKGVRQTQVGIDHLYVNTVALLGMLQILGPQWGEVAGEIKDLTANIGDAVEPTGDMVDAVMVLAEYYEQAPGDVERVQIAIDHLYLNTIAILGMLQILAPKWGDTAELIHEQTAFIGDAVKPVGDMVKATQALADYYEQAPGDVERVQVAIDHLYLNTMAIVGMLRVLAPSWGDIAADMDEQSKAIGDAAGPVSDMAGALEAIADYGATEPGKDAQRFEAGLAWLYANTLKVVGMVNVLAPSWGDIAAGLTDQAKAIGDAVAPVGEMVDALGAVAGYVAAKDLQQSVNALAVDLNILVTKLRDQFAKVPQSIVDANTQAGKAAAAVAALFEPVSTIVDTLLAVTGYQRARNIGAAVDAMLADTNTVVTRLRNVYSKVPPIIIEANEQATRAAVAVAGLLEPAQTIVDVLGAIGEYKLTRDLGKKIDRMISDARMVGSKLVLWFQTWKKETWDNVDMGGTAMGKLDAMFAPIQTIVDSLSGIANYTGATASQVTLFLDSAETVTDLIANWVAQRGPDFAEKLAQFGAYTTPVLTTWAEALGPINDILTMASGILDITKDKAYQIQFPITAALDALVAIGNEVRLWVFSQGPGFQARMDELKEVTTGAVQTMVDALTPIQNIISMASGLASEKDWELAKSFQSLIGPALTAIIGGINTAIDALNKSEVRESLYDTGFATGQDLGLGIVAGIYSMITPVQSAVAAIYGAAGAPPLDTARMPGAGYGGPVATTPVVYQNTVAITGNTFVGGDNATIQLIASLVEARLMATITRRAAGKELAVR